MSEALPESLHRGIVNRGLKELEKEAEQEAKEVAEKLARKKLIEKKKTEKLALAKEKAEQKKCEGIRSIEATRLVILSK